MPPRAVRLNNPCNLRRSSIVWMGHAAEQPDPEFVAFKSPEWGFRAAFKTLRTYQTKYGLRSVEQMITRWAPPSENPTAAYVRRVAVAMGVGMKDPVDLTNVELAVSMLAEMSLVEAGGRYWSTAVIRQGIELGKV